TQSSVLSTNVVWATEPPAEPENSQEFSVKPEIAQPKPPSLEPESKRRVTPYFNMTLSEGTFIPSKGDIFTGGQMNTHMGVLWNIRENHSLFGLYNFKYTGPAFQPQDGREFQDRSISHAFNFEHRWKFHNMLRLRPGLALTREFRRTGANEAWTEGLYNMNSLGGQLALDYLFDYEESPGLITFQWLYRQLKFPNYTDLLREFQGAGSASELSGGLQDQKLQQISVRPSWNKYFLGVSYSWQSYDSEKVVESNGVYGSTAQKDTNTSFDFGFNQRLWRFELMPSVAYTLHRSNQNFLRFAFFGDTSPVFIAQNYDYNELNFTIPLDILLTKNLALSGGWGLVLRSYTDRPPRDSTNNYLTGEKQKNTLSTLSGGLRFRLNEISLMRLTYSLVVASSNNHFERYLPYNYTGHNLGLSFQLSY
ncbi:MAG: hypothetical protein HY400_03375, partial [Elusimicrobia bacterium]|nr:hypothetical protein [Elusimicrobiota bacterium]